MYLSEEQLKKYSCKLEKKFIEDFLEEYRSRVWFDQTDLYDSNDMLEFLYGYPEVNDKSKQFYFYMCMKTFNDVPKNVQHKYYNKFAHSGCGKEIYNSYACSNSNLLIDCNDIKNSFGCNNCKFSHHLLYCDNIRHKQYMVFNKEVTRQRFNELISLSPEKLQSVPEFNPILYAKINSKIEYIYKLK